MKCIAGIFASRQDARRAFERLRASGVMEEHLNLLEPGEAEREMRMSAESRVPPTNGTEPADVGAGQALGSILGGASGLALGPVATAAITALIPGIGPVVAIGVAASALLGIGGGVLGARLGERVDEKRYSELPHDEIYVYENALRNGHSVVIATVDDLDEVSPGEVTEVFKEEGAEEVDLARDRWWSAIRASERDRSVGSGVDFDTAEPRYRSGFEAALHTPSRGHSYQEAHDYLAKSYPDQWSDPAFRTGYERGCEYYSELKSKYGASSSTGS